LIKKTPAVGWVRADELPTKDATLELLKLRQHVEDLQAELSNARTTAPKGSEDLAQGEELYSLNYSFHAENMETGEEDEYTSEFEATWNKFFGTVAPMMINEASDDDLKLAMDHFVYDQNEEDQSKDKDFRQSDLSEFKLNDADFQTIKIQLRALGLINKSEKARSLEDTTTYWTLTPYGDEVMTRLRAIKRTMAQKTKPKVAKGKKKAGKG
jgi:hypothetical protein